MRKVAGGEASAVPHTTFVGHSARQSATNPMILKDSNNPNRIRWGEMATEAGSPLDTGEAEGPEGAEGGSCDCPKACMLDKLYAAGMILRTHDLDLEGGMNSPEDATLAEELEEMMEGGGEPEGPI